MTTNTKVTRRHRRHRVCFYPHSLAQNRLSVKTLGIRAEKETTVSVLEAEYREMYGDIKGETEAEQWKTE